MLSVGILVDLIWRPHAGGQVKCWERFAEASVAFRDTVDVTIHFLGDEQKTVILSSNVRYITHPPSLGTARFRIMNHLIEHTDLAPLHPRLFGYLRKYDVIHVTDTGFSLAKTGLRFATRAGTPLICSIHTDILRYARIHSVQAIHRLFKNERLCHLLLDRFRFDERCSSYMLRRLDRCLGRCDWVFASRHEDLQRVIRLFPSKRVSFLRRGIDKESFHPKWRDRWKLTHMFGIPQNRFLLLFVGRINPEKNVMVLAEAARILLDRSEPIHVMVVGTGVQKEAVRNLLGSAVTFPGVVPQSTLAWLYASADLFVFPSETEVCPNVVIEAKASGLPVLVSATGGSAQCLKKPDGDGLILGENNPDLWAEAIGSLMRSPTIRARMGEEARKHIESEWPSWEDVIANDLIPVWQAVARGTHFQGLPHRPERQSLQFRRRLSSSEHA